MLFLCTCFFKRDVLFIHIISINISDEAGKSMQIIINNQDIDQENPIRQLKR